MTPQEKEEFAALKEEVASIPRLVRFQIAGDARQYVLMGSVAIHIKNPAMVASMGLGGQAVRVIATAHSWAQLPQWLG